MPYDVFIGCPEDGELQKPEDVYAQLDASGVQNLAGQAPDLTFMQHDENVAGDKRLRVFLLRNQHNQPKSAEANPSGISPEMLPQVTDALRDVLTMMERKATELGIGYSPSARGSGSEGVNHIPGHAPAADEQPSARRMSPVRIHIFSAPTADEKQTVHHFGVRSETTGRELVSASKQISRIKTRNHRIQRRKFARIRDKRDAKFEKLRIALARQLERESFFRARLTVWRMLRLRPRHGEARMAKRFLKEHAGFGTLAAALVMFFPDLFMVLGEEIGQVGRVLAMPFTKRRRVH
jgi:hypothetical protein